VNAAEEAKASARKPPPPPNSAGTSEPPAGPPTDPFTAELERALADVKTALGTMAGARRTPLFPVNAAELLGKVFPDQQWQVDGLLTLGGVAIIGGPPKIARKTWGATEIAVAIVTGSKVFGEFRAAPGAVAYFYAEDTERQVRNRIRALLAGAERAASQLNRLYLQPCGVFLDITRDEDLALIVASARRLGPITLLVLDPFRDISSAAEDKSDEMSPVMRRLRLLSKLLGCTVLVNHHSGKPSEATSRRSGGQQLRGSGAIHGAINCGIYMTDCDGDGVSVFTNTIESEVKGARSAGVFKLELRIEDDANGEATSARWSVTRGKPAATKTAEKHAAEDESAFAFVRTLAMRGESLTRTGLREHDEAPLSDKIMRAALDRLLAAKRLILGPGGRVVIPGPEPAGDEP
jgi:hypothetical protein